MVWFLVDDTMTFHLKVTTAGNAAIGLWTRAGAWSAFNRTDGYIPITVLHQIGSNYQAQKLVKCGLWSRVTGGYQFHDWDHRQPSSEQVNQRRKRARERQARHRQKKQAVTRDATRDLARGRETKSLKGLGLVTHQGNAPGGTGAAPPAAAAPTPPTPEPEPPALPPNPPKRNRADPFEAMADLENPPPEDRTEYINAANNHRASIRAALQKKPQAL